MKEYRSIMWNENKSYRVDRVIKKKNYKEYVKWLDVKYVDRCWW